MFPDRLREGYRAFLSDRFPQEQSRFEELAATGQKPQIMLVGCCDSRVSPEVIFDARPGELFVVRNVANIVPPYQPDAKSHGTSAALEFAVQVLKVKEIVVMGHGRCGGCRVALTGELKDAVPGEGGFIAEWIGLLDEVRGPVVDCHGTEGRIAEHAMEQAAVQVSLANLRSFPCIREKERAGELRLTGAIFAISDGLLHLLDEASGTYAPVAVD